MTGIPLDQLKETPGARPGESRATRVKRLAMRSMRRGIKEMDIILHRYATAQLDQMSDEELDLYEALLSENDQDLYQWVSGQQASPPKFSDLITHIAGRSTAR